MPHMDEINKVNERKANKKTEVNRIVFLISLSISIGIAVPTIMIIIDFIIH